jgi:hypothetical protein
VGSLTLNVYGAIVGGVGNLIQTNTACASVGGGYSNSITGSYGAIPGGDQNVAGTNSLAAGHRAKALHTGSFVWGDSTDQDFTSTGTNQFLIRASGGVGIGTTSLSRALEVHHSGDTEIGLQSTDSGAHLWTLQSSSTTNHLDLDASFQIIDRTVAASRFLIDTNGRVGIGNASPTNLLAVGTGGAYCNGTTWVNGSDRNAKEDFRPVNPEDVLAKVASLPITQWQYKVDGPGIAHLGPWPRISMPPSL